MGQDASKLIGDKEREISKFLKELETEDRLVRVGLKEESESEKIFQKYKELFSKKQILEISKILKSAKDKKIPERIYFFVISSFIGLAIAKRQDKISTYFSKAKVKIEDTEISYFEVNPRISKERNFEKREKLEEAASAVVSAICKKQLEVLLSEIQVLKGLGFSSYMDYCSQAKKVDYGKFYILCKKIETDTDSLWDKTIKRASREVLKKPFFKIASCHMSFLRSISEFDNYFLAERVVPTFQKFAKDLGFSDILASIKIDDEPRPKKNPRAVCYWPDPPKEVHLVIKPIGGEQDFEAMFHEGGHALHAASEDPNLIYTYKALARSNALTEAYAFIFEDLIYDLDFLSSTLNLSAHTAGRIQWQAYFVNLMLLRRYLGKFFYEYALFSSGDFNMGPELYSKNLGDLTGFVYRDLYWLSDMDSAFYSVDYLRAWIGAAQIKDYIRRKFGKRWFQNPACGKFLRELFAEGVRFELEEVVSRLGYKPFDIGYLINSYKILV